MPTYVCEFLLGRYCASTDEDEIQEGLQIVERQLRDRAVRSGEEELFKARAREKGSVKLIDIISARLDAKTDSYLATLPSLQLKDVSIDDKLVRDNERMLTGGFYAEVDLSYDARHRPGEERPAVRCRCPAAHPALEAGRAGRPSTRAGRRFTTAEWKQLPAAQRRPGADADDANATGRAAPPHGARSWRTTTTWSSSAPAARARATCSSRFRPTPTWSAAARRPSPGCS